MKNSCYLILALMLLSSWGLNAQDKQKKLKKDVIVISVSEDMEMLHEEEEDIMIKVDVQKEDGRKKFHMILRGEDGERAEFSWEGTEEEAPAFIKDHMVERDEVIEDGEKRIVISIDAENSAKRKECAVIIEVVREEEDWEEEHWEETEQDLAPLPDNLTNDEALRLEEIEFYPVPTSSVVQLKFKTNPGPVQIDVFDQYGRSIYQEDIKSFNGQYQGEINLRGNAPGTYFLNISQEGRSHTERLILQE